MVIAAQWKYEWSKVKTTNTSSKQTKLLCCCCPRLWPRKQKCPLTKKIRGSQSCRLQLLLLSVKNTRSHHFENTCFAPVPPAIHLLLGQSKTSQQYIQQNKKINKPKLNQRQIQIKAKSGLEHKKSNRKTSTWIKMFSDVFNKHCMQKQIIKTKS